MNPGKLEHEFRRISAAIEGEDNDVPTFRLLL